MSIDKSYYDDENPNFNWSCKLSKEEHRIWAPTAEERKILFSKLKTSVQPQTSNNLETKRDQDINNRREVYLTELLKTIGEWHQKYINQRQALWYYFMNNNAQNLNGYPSTSSVSAGGSSLLPSMTHRSSKKKICKFCLRNGEIPEIYIGHEIKDAFGNVTCPVLRRYKCPICGATEAKSHTLKYCPQYYK